MADIKINLLPWREEKREEKKKEFLNVMVGVLLMAGLIVDGFHLRPEEVQTFYKVKGPERVILTSDVTKLAGMPPGEYTWDEKTVVLTPEGVIRYPAQNVLAGAAAPIITGVANIMRFTQCSLADAIHMASRNPARLHGLDDRGEIRPGRRARPWVGRPTSSASTTPFVPDTSCSAS